MNKILGAFLLTACLSAQQQGQATQAPVAQGQGHIRNFHRIDDHISRGRQPNKYGFEELAHEGFKTVLDLRGGPVHEPHERKVVEGLGMHYISIRLSGIWAPHDDQIAKILAVMEDPARWPIFVHCRRGDDRLGMAIACYRIAYDHWSNQKAFDEATQIGLSRFEPFMRRYIRHFDPSRIPVNTAAVGNSR